MNHLDEYSPGPLKYLFVVTYGRSGSTTLQAALNSIPGYLIRGENRQAIKFLHQYHTTLMRERENFRKQQDRRGEEPGSMGPSNPFFGIDNYPVDQALTSIRNLATETLLRPAFDTRVAGFKEIRWYQPDVEDFIEWLRSVFPGARFLVNSRRHEDVASSGWWSKDPKALDKLGRMEETFTQLTQRLGEDAHHVQYEDYNGRADGLAPMFTWLGEHFDHDRISDVLARRHSY